MSKSSVAVIGVAALLGLMLACTSDSSTPLTPATPGTGGGSSTASDGSTLKVTAPVTLSPVGAVKPPDGSTTLVISPSTASFVGSTPVQYRFQVFNSAGNVVENSELVKSTSYDVASELVENALYSWWARAEHQGSVGPWSSKASFIAPLPGGYLKGNELYDPLTNGKTIGTVVGPVSFIKGVGAMLESFDSRIVYELQEPLEDGEISALVTNVATNTEGDKTKIFSMAQGYDDVTTNPYRMTVEKRGDGPPGAIAWRFLTGDDEGIDTVGAERVVVEFDPAETYFWEADWRDGFFRVRINRGGVNGTNIYDFGKAYGGFYRAVPHVVYLGGGPARGGPTSQTVPGMIIRQVWVSQRPRPTSANR